jgi:hypothetical protein
MIKKLTAYSFILLANIVLLAHVVVSHHYHQNVVCVESSHCQDNNLAHKHNTQEDNHQHDGSSSANCLLKQAVIVSSNQGKNETDCVFCSHLHSLDLHFTLPYTGNEVIIPICRIVASPPDVFFSFSSYITTSLGLRAPPIV